MSNPVKHADVLPDGVLLTLKDGREALLSGEDIVDCAEKTSGFEHAADVRAKADADAAAEDAEQP